MALTPISEIMAAMGDNATARDKAERLQHEIDKDYGGDVSLYSVLDEYVTSVADFLGNIVLDLADDVGALPSRKKAQREFRDALALMKVVAVYRACEKNEVDDGDE